MVQRTLPYRAEHYALAPTRDGRRVELRATTAAAAARIGAPLASFGPWAHYGQTAAALIASMSPADDERVRLELTVDGATAGCVMIQPAWLLGPYLNRIAVFPDYQGLGLGGRILDWYEAEARQPGQAFSPRSLWLCVTGFNADARRLYARHGFEITAIIDSLVRAGDDELLMRKRLA